MQGRRADPPLLSNAPLMISSSCGVLFWGEATGAAPVNIGGSGGGIATRGAIREGAEEATGRDKFINAAASFAEGLC